MYVKGRQHPVKIYHTAVSQPDYVDAAMRVVVAGRKHQENRPDLSTP